MESGPMRLKADRVRNSTLSVLNSRIDVATAYSISYYKRQRPEVVEQRVQELDREWDIERVLEWNAATLALTGLLLGLKVNRKWFALPGLFLPCMLLQAWCPPLLLLRWFGVRTRSEIDREKYALEPLLARS